MNIRLRNCINILNYAIEHNISASSASQKNNKGKNYVSNFVEQVEKRKAAGQISLEEYSEFMDAYNRYQGKNSDPTTTPLLKTLYDSIQGNLVSLQPLKRLDTQPLTEQEKADIAYNAELDDAFDERSVGDSVRDENGRIKHYYYKILINGQPPLEGTFSREEMDKVYRLYSNLEGAGMNLRAVSREFNNLSYRDFKRIIRAFKITKQSIAVAPHILEENSEDVITEYVLRNKENNVLKKLEADKSKYIERSYIEVRKQLLEHQSVEEHIQSIVEKYIEKRDDQEIKAPIFYKNPAEISHLRTPQGKPTMAIFGDIHYGKKFSSPVYGRGYNKTIAHERVMQIGDNIIDDYLKRNPSEIHLMCVGDLVECILEDGMHPGHTYEMDLYKEDQIFYAVDSLKAMLQMLQANVDCPIYFHSIHGNHDRIGAGRDDDKNRTAGKIISHILRRELESDKLRFNIPPNNLIRLVAGKICTFVQHGDSSLSKKKPSELVNLHGEPGCYTVLLQGHWHTLRAEEGTNYVMIKIPSVASTDSYIMETLGNNNLPGFIMGHEPNNCYGFNYSKITLY